VVTEGQCEQLNKRILIHIGENETMVRWMIVSCQVVLGDRRVTTNTSQQQFIWQPGTRSALKMCIGSDRDSRDFAFRVFILVNDIKSTQQSSTQLYRDSHRTLEKVGRQCCLRTKLCDRDKRSNEGLFCDEYSHIAKPVIFEPFFHFSTLSSSQFRLYFHLFIKRRPA